jgi:histidyl-tRNA synthetase
VNARAALVIGEAELAARAIVVRDLATRVQETRPFEGDARATAAGILTWYAALPHVAPEAA